MRSRALAMLVLALPVMALAPAPTHAAFEDVNVSPRARATGDAGAVAPGDAWAALHNPSGLAWCDGWGGAASYLQPFSLGFASQSAAAASLPLPGRAGGLGLAVRSFGVRYLGQTLENETTVSLSHGFLLVNDAQSQLAVGWTMSWYSLSFGTSVSGLDPGGASTFGLGIGATAVVRDRTRVGFAAQNLNNPSIGDRDREDLLRRVSGGLAYTPYAGVTTLLDMSAELGEAVEYRGGVEVETADFLVLRAGVRTEPNTFATGFGLRFRGLRLDYGYSSGGGVLDGTHHIGIEAFVRGRGGRRP